MGELYALHGDMSRGSLLITPVAKQGDQWLVDGPPLTRDQDYAADDTTGELRLLRDVGRDHYLIAYDYADHSEDEAAEEAAKDAERGELREKYETAIQWLDKAQSSKTLDIQHLATILATMLKIMRREIGDE